MNPKVNFFFDKATQWKDEYELLRTIVLESGLTEELKWGCPCYTIGKGNVVLIHGFKEYCALLFMKGALMTDPQNILIQQTENVQSARQIRFTHINEIKDLNSVLKDYIQNAIEIEKSGTKVELKKTSDYQIVEEFKNVLEENEEIKVAFEKLTPGRQRAYLMYFAQAKQSKTKEARIEKCIPDILIGKGLNQ